MNSTPLTDEPPAGHFRSGVMLAVFGTFLFALKSILIKLAFAQGVQAAEFLMIRMVFSLPFYVGVILMMRRQSQLPKMSSGLIARTMLLGFLGYYLASLLDLIGLQYISAQLERLTLFTYPAIVAFLAWMFLGEHVGWKIFPAIGLSYLGVALMYGQESSVAATRGAGSQADTAWGVMMVIGAALSYSFYILFAKPIMKQIGSPCFTSLAMIGSTGFMAVHFGLRESYPKLLTFPVIVYVYGSVLAFACTVLPSFMINEAIMRIGATRTTVIGSAGPVLTMIVAIIVLDEPSSVMHFAGMAVAIAGISLITFRK